MADPPLILCDPATVRTAITAPPAPGSTITSISGNPLAATGLPEGTTERLVRTIVQHASAHDYTVWQIILHGSLVTGEYDPRHSDIDLAILTDGREGWRHCARQLREIDERIDPVWIRADTCYRLRSYPLSFEARILTTGLTLYQLDDLPAFPATSYAAAREECAQACFARAADVWIRGRRELQQNILFRNLDRDVCLSAYLAAAWAVKGALTALEVDHRPKSVRWHLARLLQLLVREAPAFHRLQRFSPCLPDYFYRTQTQVEAAPPQTYPIAASRKALWAAVKIVRSSAPAQTLAYLSRAVAHSGGLAATRQPELTFDLCQMSGGNNLVTCRSASDSIQWPLS